MSSSLFFFSSRRRHTIFDCDWSSDVCSSDLSWTYSLLDMAIYPVLLIQYLGFFLPGLGSLERWIVALAMIWGATWLRSEEHTSELQSQSNLVCRLLLEKKTIRLTSIPLDHSP